MQPETRIILGTFIWGGLILLQGIVMAIARFYEHTSNQPTGYRLYLLPMALTGIGMVRYLRRISSTDRWPDFVGDPVANVLWLIAGLTLIALGNSLYDRMMGSASTTTSRPE